MVPSVVVSFPSSQPRIHKADYPSPLPTPLAAEAALTGVVPSVAASFPSSRPRTHKVDCPSPLPTLLAAEGRGDESCEWYIISREDMRIIAASAALFSLLAPHPIPRATGWRSAGHLGAPKPPQRLSPRHVLIKQPYPAGAISPTSTRPDSSPRHLTSASTRHSRRAEALRPG